MRNIPGYTISAVVCETDDLVVYQATRVLDDLPVLLKVPVSPSPSPSLLRRLEHEFELVQNPDAKGIVRALGLERHPGSIVLVLEGGSTRTLASLVGFPMDISTFLRIALGLTEALAELHHQGLVHRDLKPEHVLLDQTGQVRLTGLGFASRCPRERQALLPPEIIPCSLAYMAPEQTGRMNRSTDSRSDLYALGVIFYQLLTRELPFSAGDPMEWVHCHIARQAVPPAHRVPEIPEPLSKIVMKLLAKTAEERFQTASGLKADLRQCLGEWESKDRIGAFPLGRHDASDRLKIPEKLYGRESEIRALLAAFDRVVTSGEAGLVLVSGYSGIGKSSVVQELHKALVSPRGFFAAGKFDQYGGDIPFATLVQALQSLIRQILCKSKTELGRWRDALEKSLSPNAEVIINLIPEVEIIIGKQPSVPALPPQEGQNRFQMVLRRFIGVFATPEHPLALFLDDLQWVDGATLELLKHLTTESEVRCLLLVGAYRSNEVTPSHPLMRTLETIREAGARMEEIVLAPLSINDVGNLIADSLHGEREPTQPLIQLVHEKTGGNPFFAIQFLLALEEEHLLVFDPDAAIWTWNLERIHAKGCSDNVVDLMVRKLGHFPGPTREILAQMAFLGNSANLPTLTMVSGQSEDALSTAFWPAIHAGLVFRREDAFAFLHDRVQEAAYALVPKTGQSDLHLKLGRALLAKSPEGELTERVFDIVNQFNHSLEIVTDPEERKTVRQLNVQAGRKARAASAFVAAESYLAQALELLPKDTWNQAFEESLALFLDLAECEYLIGDFQRSDELLTLVLEKAVSPIDRSRAFRLRQRLFQLSGRYREAMMVALDALRLFGITLPESDEDIRAATEAEIRLVPGNLHERRISDLVATPETDKADIRAVIGLLAEAMPLIYTARPVLWPLITVKGVNLCLLHGHVEESSFVYSCYSMVLVSVCGDIPSAIQFSEMAMNLNERFPGAIALRGKLLFHHGAVVNIWCQHFTKNLPLLEKAFLACLNAGDLVCAGFLTYNAVWLRLENGDSLDNVLEAARQYSAFARQSHNDIISHVVRIEEQFASCLMGNSHSSTTFNDAFFDEAACVTALKQAGFGLGIAYYHIMKQISAFIFGRFPEALECAARVRPMLLQVASMANEATYHFYFALTLTALYPQASPEQQAQFKRALEEPRQKLKGWTEHCPENFFNRHLLLTAELARIEGRELEAMRLYDQAINASRDQGFVHLEALASELASHFYRTHGFEKAAAAYLGDAHRCYSLWGALGKVRQLEQQFPQLRKEAGLASAAAFSTGIKEIDLLTVVKASQAISSEILLDNLLKTLMRIILENAGAQKGSLFLCQEEVLSPTAVAHVENQQIIVFLHHEAFPNLTMYPASILDYVRRSREIILLEDASRPNPFFADEYFSRQSPKSVLCFPIIRQTKLIGVFYLENDLTTHAFSSEKLALLEVLACQAAISMENALVYQALQASEKKYRCLVDTASEGIWMFGPNLVTTAVNPRMSEMLGLSCEEMVGRPVSDFVFQEGASKHPEEMERPFQGQSGHFECRLRRKDEATLWVLVAAAPIFNEGGDFNGSFWMLTDITDRRKMEQEHLAHWRFLEGMDRVNRAIQGAGNLDQMMSDVLDVVLSIFNCDRVFLMYPCDPEAPSWQIPMERNKPEYPGVLALGGEILWEREVAEKCRILLSAEGPVKFGPGANLPLPKEIPEKFGFKCFIGMALYPKVGKAWEFGLHQCSFPRIWTSEEERLFQEIGRRLADALTSLLMYRDLGQREDELRCLNKELEQRVIDRTSRLEEANKELEAFAYSVAHDLRAPLRHIDGFLELLRGEVTTSLNKKGLDYFSIISGSTKRMTGLIDDLLAFSRLGRNEMLKRSVDLGILAQEVIRDLEPETKNRKIHWSVSALPVIPGDRKMLRQVLFNLISNALKYTRPRPQAEIEIGRISDQKMETIYIRDNGVGFSMEYAGKLFGVFQRLHRVEEFDGNGIGLANVRRIIHRHGGKTWAEGTENQGATFFFSLPHQIQESSS
jgi:PAS domain S-box-containing protein